MNKIYLVSFSKLSDELKYKWYKQITQPYSPEEKHFRYLNKFRTDTYDDFCKRFTKKFDEFCNEVELQNYYNFTDIPRFLNDAFVQTNFKYITQAINKICKKNNFAFEPQTGEAIYICDLYTLYKNKLVFIDGKQVD